MAGRVKIKSKRNVKVLQGDKKYDSENDISVLSKPFTTSLSGVTGTIKAMNTATDEIRDYLTYECEVIYECKICRNIFRSISNFILHKRTYCQEKYNCVVHLKCANNRKDDYFNVNEKEVVQEKEKIKIKQNTEPNKSKKSLSALIERIAQRKQFGFERENFSIGDFYKKSDNGPLASSLEELEYNLEHISGSSSGVFQTVSKSQDNCDNKIDEMQLEVAEIHDMLEGQSVVLGPDGKIMDLNKGYMTRSALLSDDFSVSESDRTCELCDIKFATRKTYASHIKYKHSDSRLVYPCPECSEVYASSWSVYRHLFNIHRKTLAQVRKLRDNIQAKAYFQVQSSSKKSPQSSKSNLNEQQRIDNENQEWMDNFETDNDMQMCGGCGKRFERRAALNSHSQTCQKRIAARNTIVVNRSKRTAATEDKPIDKKPAKIPKLDPIPEIKEDRRKPSVLRKRKIGIQIRYDYNKSNEKGSSSPVPSNEDNNKKSCENLAQKEIATDSENAENVDTDRCDSEISNRIFTSELVANTEELYSIIGIPTTKKRDVKEEKAKENKDPSTVSDVLMDPEVLSIHSSNNSTPNKEEDTLNQDDTDSEIEEIFGPPVEIENNLFRVSDINTKKDNDKLLSVNENTLKLIKLIGSTSPPKNKTLDEKMINYVDIKKLHCKSCDIKFGNLSKLRCHMALHFNWMRYCCDVCSTKAYEKSTIYDHIKNDHGVEDMDKIEAVIFQIPEWETMERASEFMEISSEQKSDEEISVQMIEIDQEKSSTPDSCIFVPSDVTQLKTPKGRGRPPKRKTKITSKFKKKNNDDQDENLSEENMAAIEKDMNEMKTMKDVALRKMVFEVIFGQDSDSVTDPHNSVEKADIELSKEDVCLDALDVSNVISRPVRNRVKPVDKDFIYDLNEFTDTPRSVSQNGNRVLGQHEKHITGSLEDLSANNKNVLKKPGKRPGPKCKTISPNEISDNRIVNFNLQKHGRELSEECCKLRDKEEKETVESVDDEVWIIEDD